MLFLIASEKLLDSRYYLLTFKVVVRSLPRNTDLSLYGTPGIFDASPESHARQRIAIGSSTNSMEVRYRIGSIGNHSSSGIESHCSSG